MLKTSSLTGTSYFSEIYAQLLQNDIANQIIDDTAAFVTGLMRGNVVKWSSANTRWEKCNGTASLAATDMLGIVECVNTPDTTGQVRVAGVFINSSLTANTAYYCQADGTLGTTATATFIGYCTANGRLCMASAGGSGGTSGPQNQIINGSFDVWQRQTTFTVPSASPYHIYTADMWDAYRSAGGAVTVTRQASGLPLTRYCARIQRNAGDTGTQVINFQYNQETDLSAPLAGQQVTFAFRARAGANFSAASGHLTAQLITGTGTNQALRSGLTGSANTINETPTLTTDWQKFSYAVTLPSNMTQYGLNLSYTPVGTAGANDYFEVGQVQVIPGASAPSFDVRPFPIELSFCQRYWETSYEYGTWVGTSNKLASSTGACASTAGNITFAPAFKVQKALTPTFTAYSPGNGVANYFWDYNATSDRSITAYYMAGKNSACMTAVPGGTGYNGFVHWVADSTL